MGGNEIKDEANNPVFERINIPLYLVLNKSDLRGPLTADEKQQLYELMVEEQQYQIIRNVGLSLTPETVEDFLGTATGSSYLRKSPKVPRRIWLLRSSTLFWTMSVLSTVGRSFLRKRKLR